MDNEQDNNLQEPVSKKYIAKTAVSLFALIFLAAAILILRAKPYGSAKISWDSNKEADLAGYKIYYGTAKRTGDCPPGGYAEKVDIGKSPGRAFDNLKTNSTYYFSVTSYDSSGNESCFSQEISKTIPKSTFMDRVKAAFKVK